MTCCKCDAPSEHTSPGGDMYCTTHYMCVGGHVPVWKQHNDVWLCACTVKLLMQPPCTASYVPVTLPSLPRAKCPHATITMKRVSGEMWNGKPGSPCKGAVLTHGWCEYHAGSHALLEIGARLGYPEVVLCARIIGDGVACWEAYAETVSIIHAKQDAVRLYARYNLS